MNRGIHRILALGALPLLSACQAGTAADTSAIEVIASGTHCGPDEAALEMVSSPSALSDTPSSIASAGRAVLEAGDSVLVVYLGQKPTSGYGAEMAGARSDGNRLRVELNATEPEPGAMTAQVITTPCVGLRIPSNGWSELEVAMAAEGFPLTLQAPD